jgi:prepilin-type N-terminal cleavage/methylation domain-containing protein
MSSAGATSNHRGGLRRRPRQFATHRRGVTLLEMLIAVALLALLAGLTYPSLSAGLDTLRLRSASNDVVSLLAAALDHAGRRQQVVEIQILPADNVLLARSADLAFQRRVAVPQPMRIGAVEPAIPGAPAGRPRRFLVYPGGAAPGVGIELVNPKGARRLVRVDPFTATPRALEVKR